MITLNYDNNKKSITIPTKIFINNEWVDSIDCNENFSLINPTNEECLGIIGLGGRKDVDRAVEAARSAIRGKWSTMAPLDRGILLNKLADKLEEKREQMATIESINVGKPIGESLVYDLKQSITFLRYFAGWADKITGRTIPISSSSDTSTPTRQVLAYTKQVPLGVCALILPWNFPLQLLMFKLAPALAAGNTVIIKPSEFTPLSTFYLAELIKEVGFPPGVVNVVCGLGSVVGDAMSSHMKINKIGFTGSTKVGKMVQNSATNSNLKHCSLELGGKSPIIIFNDVEDLDLAVIHSFHGLFWNAGQCCSAASRIYVQSGIYDQFVEKIKKQVESRVLGDPLSKDTHQGPQVNKFQFESILRYIETGKREGATLVCGGKRFGNKGYYIEPTVFSNVTDVMTIAREEIFGPVMSILRFETVQEAIDRANDSEFGLVGAVFTKDINKSIIVSDQVQSGLVWVNSFNIIDPSIPWGGFKSSGKGRDASEYCLSVWTETKTTVLDVKL
ncbi:aldehyde dehydrogenase [Dictyostelium discoideum AX4]|uniref:Aldehyde dehydrogenase n=1 Tax=Dictyostelium discoideum TaxID=44689 RepID=Q54IU0_DICDI|nr:aldehyde dehydrogenase [Dictyostelium discoideum AX4]EAL63182.1 aldehyde dehydrogenase [Dictyostelium discoideum AX4]|eukprot:XP_636686.1 aldehyde dehydrogenase [Dictyostelium discoideum AX4]